MQDILISSNLDELVRAARGAELAESALAIFDEHGAMRYSNRAFDRINAALRDRPEGHHTQASLLGSSDIAAAVQGTVQRGEKQCIRGTYFYNRQSTVHLTLVIRPIVSQSTQRPVGAVLTIGEESIEFEGRAFARAQNSLQSLAQRVQTLSKEKLNTERLIRVLLKEAPVAMVLLNKNRQVLQINKAAEILFGIAAKSIIGNTCDVLFSCHQQHGTCPAQNQNSSVAALEIEGVTPDGRRLSLLRSTVKFTDLDGPVILEAYVDLTEQKRSEGQYRRLNEYNNLILNSTDEGIIGVDPDLRCTFANPAAAKLLGYSVDEIIGQDIIDFVHTTCEDGSSIARGDIAISKALINDAAVQVDDAEFIHKDGSTVPVQYRCNPIHDHGAVVGAVIVYRNVAEARALTRQLDYLATHDSLTGLINRRVFENRLENAIDVAYEENVEHVLCFIDLDQFKIVNDTCGHIAGDELLRQISELLRHYLRKTDTLARLGGDEFAVLLERCGKDKGVEIIKSLHRALSEYRFNWNNKAFPTGASVGVVVIDQNTIDSTDAMSVADAACYVAKESGRNRIHVHEHGDKELARRQGEVQQVAQIRTAFERNQFSLCYQPIVALGDTSDIGRYMEVLVRMRGASNELLSPSVFIPTAERYNLMPALDRWVVAETFSWLRAHRAQLKDLDRCSINLSGQSLNDERFLEFLLQQLKAYDLPEGLLCFEITETAAIANLARASLFIRKIKESGHCFALDDFGSGMSSFMYLKNLPIDFLKIDGSFVKDMAEDPVDYAMVEAIHHVGNVLGIKTIAEFVESATTLDSLRKIGVDYAQGYGICRPRPVCERLLINPRSS